MPRRPALALLLLAACGGPSGHVSEDSTFVAARVVSQTILGDEVLWALGPAARARVVGVSALADDPRYSGVAGQWPAEVPRRALTSEGLLALDPDLAIIAGFTAPEVRALLAARGVRELELTSFSGFADYRRDVRRISAAVGAQAEGERLIAEFDARIAALAARRPALTRSAASWGSGYTAGAGTSFDDVAEAAGLKNLSSEKGLQGHAPIALEQLVAWDPEVLVVSCPAVDPDDPACRAAEADAAAMPGLSATRAARSGDIVAIPGRDLSSTGAGMATAAELLHARLQARPAGGAGP